MLVSPTRTLQMGGMSDKMKKKTIMIATQDYDAAYDELLSLSYMYIRIRYTETSCSYKDMS